MPNPPENRKINTGRGNYNERIEGDYIQGNVFKRIINIFIGHKSSSESPNSRNRVQQILNPDVIKYFFYVSKSKIEMLSPQIGIQKSNNIISATLITEKYLSNNNQIQSLSNLSSSNLSSSSSSLFYEHISKWKHGIFLFDEDCTKIATYLAWTLFEDSLFLLIGSPNNILGYKEVRKGVINDLTPGIYLRFLQLINNVIQENEYIATYINNYNDDDFYIRDNYKGTIDATGSAISIPQDSLVDIASTEWAWGYKSYKNEATDLALFCFQLLGDFPENDIQTIFRIFAKYQLPSEDSHLFRQLVPNNYKLKHVYIGSPLYVAIR